MRACVRVCVRGKGLVPNCPQGFPTALSAVTNITANHPTAQPPRLPPHQVRGVDDQILYQALALRSVAVGGWSGWGGWAVAAGLAAA